MRGERGPLYGNREFYEAGKIPGFPLPPFQFLSDELAEARRRRWVMDVHLSARVLRPQAICLVSGV
jgi:hypothetical protein